MRIPANTTLGTDEDKHRCDGDGPQTHLQVGAAEAIVLVEPAATHRVDRDGLFQVAGLLELAHIRCAFDTLEIAARWLERSRCFRDDHRRGRERRTRAHRGGVGADTQKRGGCEECDRLGGEHGGDLGVEDVDLVRYLMAN